MSAVDSAGRRHLHLPQPVDVTLRNFTLYQRLNEIRAEFNPGVFCLAGANGLGKSTFLSAINFAITGVVLPPPGGKKFLGAADFYEDAISYSADYFDGRISAADHDLAEVELTMQVGERRYHLVRGMFSPVGLSTLTIEGPDGIEDFSDAAFDDGERHRHYMDNVVRDSGLEEFSQLVFLQLVVLTFDEQRRLLFFEDRITQAALFIAFGVAAERASRAEHLLRTVDRADSLVRNLQWQATGIRRQLDALQAVGEDAEPVDERIDQQHDRLQERAEQAATGLQRAEAAAGDSAVRMADAAARLRAAETEYEALYAERLLTRRQARSHPVVVDTLRAGRCAVCGADGADVIQVVRGKVDANQCPLCESELPEPDKDDDQQLTQLQRLGEQIVALEGEVDAQRSAVDRHREAVDDHERRLRDLNAKLEAFRRDNALALARSAVREQALDDATQGLQGQINRLLERKEEQRARRQDAQRQLGDLQQELIQAYTLVEGEFVPRFTGLAREFLGLPLEIDLERRGIDLKLRLSLANSERRERDELSESQRFFIDIALRMALAQQMSRDGSPACLYIDTPEGSLDIAYESRAGSMFASFVREGEQMIMTANINTSELLKELAASCGPERMKLMRMTEWTYLTEVQSQAENLFAEAYQAIEAKLEAGG